MAKRVQLIRHNAGAASTFDGLAGEITVDLTLQALRVHDGLTSGGTPTARSDLDNVAFATSSSAGKMAAADKIELAKATSDIAENATAIAAETLARTQSIAAEAAIAAARADAGDAVDVVLQENLDVETAARIAADAALAALIQSTTLNAIYPVGSLYFGTTPTNPNAILGVGTWVAFGRDRVLISAGLSYASEATGGSKDASVVAHSHADDYTIAFGGSHSHTFSLHPDGALPNQARQGGGAQTSFDEVNPDGIHAHVLEGGVLPSGVSGINANLPPYIGVHIWKRTA